MMETVSFDFSAVRAVTFDAGGTLLTPHPSVGEVYAEILSTSIRSPLELETAFESAFSSVSKNPAVLDPDEREKDFWRQVVRETMRERRIPAGIPSPRSSSTCGTLSATEPLAGIRRLPRDPAALRDRGYRNGVLANPDHRLPTVLDETGLARLVEPSLSRPRSVPRNRIPVSSEWRKRPSGLPPEARLHVGDSRHHDLAGARDAGWTGILIRNDAGPVDLPAIGQLTDLAPLLSGPLERADPGSDLTGMKNANAINECTDTRHLKGCEERVYPSMG